MNTDSDAELIALGQSFDIVGAQSDKFDADHSFEFGDPEIRRLHDKQHAAARDLGLQILSIRATTIEGLQVKARCARWCNGGLDDGTGEFNDQEALYSVVRDLLDSKMRPAPISLAR
ncbi:MAG TPA: hypothetical protein VIJ52_05405 [Pseudolabrys sp.]|nr:hypothetical protein [Pseudolabrys sp.]